ncbi:twitchin-like [Tigriopus californicus]|uniref:twitchin-like n=1 Tax=Tigriopus californicus TaxID=6832 RepID=UPI0027DA8C2B|nr:twitchin-like [Tigriopus californicus]
MRRKSSTSNEPPSNGEAEEQTWDWENESVPLRDKGKKLKFIKPNDKHSANEGETAFIFFDVEGTPAPKVQFFKGFKDLNVEPRYKSWTNGGDGHNQVILGIRECRQEEEGGYRCVLTSTQGEIDFEFKFFVTVEGGMDFRAMLLKRKVKQKKVIVKTIEWIEKPVDLQVQEGKCESATFTARLSEKEKKGKWYYRSNDSYKDLRSTEYGLELYKEDAHKYQWTQKGDTYNLTILNPTVKDQGRYNLVVKIDKDHYFCGGTLDVKDADPEFYFVKKFKEELTGFTNRSIKLSCQLNYGGAKLKWMKDGKPISFADSRYQLLMEEDRTQLTIRKCKLEDAGRYSCEIQQFVKDGEESEIICNLNIEEYPHKFTSKLKSKNVVEHQEAAFEINCEADDCEVAWYQNGKKITPDDKRVQIISDGLKRKLVFKDTLLLDAGEITVESIMDKASCHLKVAHANRFITGLPLSTDVIEREAASFTIEVKDPDAPVEFFIAGQKIAGNDSRVEIKKLEKGRHQLIVNKISMLDDGVIEARTPSNYGDEMLSTTCTFHVAKGEERPEIGRVGPVVGVANKHCNWDVPFQVDGTQQSELEVIVMKDGKELRVGQDINLNLQDGNISLSVNNPKREKSGIYTVILRNGQGEDSRDIEVNIMDKPTPPEQCTVTDVFHDNCVVHWAPPVDDGGTEIKNYVIEAMDVSAGGQWKTCAKTHTGGERQIKCEGLENKHKYRFRVRALNKIGPSDACEMLGADILIKDPWDEPDKPGTPQIKDWGPDHCDLAWDPPESDGGAEITHYEIEYMEKNMGLWQTGKVLTVDQVKNMGGMIHGTCDGLIEGCEYQFRIKAINKGGPSLPSDPSESIIAKTRFLKPFLHQPGMYDITIKKGRTFRYDIWYGGEPPPTVVWERNGVVLKSDDRIAIENFGKKTVYCERNTVVTVTKSERATDAGHYKIRLICEGGTFEATGFVNVLDVPEKPRNLRPDEVRAEHIKLSWAPPEDDGGSPITGYQVRMVDVEGSGEWISVAETTGNTTNAMIKGLKPGHLYQFEVYAINKEGLSLPIRTRDPIKAENPYNPPSAPRDPEIVDFDNKSVTLKWHKPLDDGGRPITHYIIQKKDKFGGWFDALVTDSKNCEARIDELEARVPGLSEGKWYQFRVLAANKAGESSPSAETKPHLCRHKNLRPMIDKGAAGSKSVRVHRSAIWHIKVKGEPPPQFSWFKGGQRLHNSDEYIIATDEYQGGATAMLQVFRSQMHDAGTYTLVAENRNGSDQIDLDLIVLDQMDDGKCDMFKHGTLGCTCSAGFRHNELSAQQILMVDFGDPPPNL